MRHVASHVKSAKQDEQKYETGNKPRAYEQGALEARVILEVRRKAFQPYGIQTGNAFVYLSRPPPSTTRPVFIVFSQTALTFSNSFT